MAKRSKKGGTDEIHLKINKRNPESTDDIPLVEVSTIPNSIGNDKLDILTEGDKDPFFFAQAIKFPVVGNGDVYDVEFAESFVARNKLSAFPGDKYGHSVSWYSRQASHFYQVGSMMVGNVAWFKFYVPPETDSESNESFKKEIKINGIDLSLVTKAKYLYNEEDRNYHMIASVGGERNDAVGFGDGSMDQIVINKQNEDKEEGLEVTPAELLIKLNALITSGDILPSEVLKVLNKLGDLKTEADEASLRVMNSINDLKLGDDPLKEIKEMQTAIKENAETVREAELTTAFGAQTFNAEKQPENKKRVMAETLLNGKAVNADTIKDVKANVLFLDIAGKDADVNSDNNSVIINKDGENGKKDYSSYTM
jgi:hypothetical protein